MSKITLTAAMIQSLAAFVTKDGKHTYVFDYGYLPENPPPEYSGPIAYLSVGSHGVVAADRVRVIEDGASSTNFLGAATAGSQSVGYTRE
ncbi:hypothetical protein ACE3YX_004576, partial [Salmonella enterica]